MGHVMFGAPRVAHYHLHERLARSLTSVGHRVTVLAGGAAEAEAYTAQGFAVRQVVSARHASERVDVEEWAVRDARLAAVSGSRNALRRARDELARVADPLVRHFESEPPDLLFLHGARTGLHRMLDHIGRESGCHVVHTGRGLLPGTMQWDAEGVDGDALASRRHASHYRSCPADESFLAAALSAWLAGFSPPALSRAAVQAPSIASRMGLMLRGLAAGQPMRGWRDARVWRQARPAEGRDDGESLPLPRPPFLTVLMQSERSMSTLR